MDKLFKVNAYFDENGEDVEKVIASYLANNLNSNKVIENVVMINNNKEKN